MIRFAEQRLFWLVLGGAVLVGTIWIASPKMVSNYYRTVGYDDLQQALALLKDEYPGPDFCVAGGVKDSQGVKLLEQAVRALEQAREANPADAQTSLLLGRGYCLLGRLEKAVGAYKEFSVLKPENPLGEVEGGFAYEEKCIGEGMGKEIMPGWLQCNDEALIYKITSSWRWAEVKSKDFEEKGELYFEQDNFQDALTWLGRANFAEPDLVTPFLVSGLVYRQLENLPNAMLFFQQAIELQSTNREAWYQLGLVYEALSRWQNALDAYKEALDGTGTISESHLYFLIGYLRQYQIKPFDFEAVWNDYEAAKNDETFGINRREAGNIYYQRGLLLVGEKQWEGAIGEFKNALIFLPDHYWVRVHLAKALFQIRDTKNAKVYVLEAIRIQPENKVGYQLMGDIFIAESNPNEAQDYYTKALDIDPNDPYTLRALDELSLMIRPSE